MKTGLLMLFALAALIFAQVPSYEDYWYVYADGARIDLTVGHASPLVTDWDGDGDKDLLVGRYLYGNIMLFTNDGTNDSPVLTYTSMLQAGGTTLALPYG